MESCADGGWRFGMCAESTIIQDYGADGGGNASGAYVQPSDREWRHYPGLASGHIGRRQQQGV